VPKYDICYLKNKCYYTYSNSIVVALSHTYVIYFTWAILKLIHALIKHKNFINYICLNQFCLRSYWSLPTKLSDPYLTNHDPLPYLSCHNISINQIVKQTLFNCLICLIVLFGVFMVCYFCAVVGAKSYVLSWEKRNVVIFKKASDTHTSTYLLLYALVVSILCMIWIFQSGYEMLSS
jgi:hypothetical protein